MPIFSKNKIKIGIIGGGVCGIIASISAASRGYDVTILERNDRIGKKLLVTGNGMCNLTNKNIELDHYNRNNEFINTILSKFDNKKLINFTNSLGIETYVDESGRVFPQSKQASSVLDLLRLKLDQLNINVMCGEKVISIDKTQDKFIVLSEKKRFIFNKIIIAAGGKSYPHLGTDGSMYEIMEQLGHTIKPTRPALSPIKLEGGLFKTAVGSHIDAKITLTKNNKAIRDRRGEIIFTNYGISGIPVINLSNYISDFQSSSYKLLIDFFPSLSHERTISIIKKRIKILADAKIEYLFTGWINKRIGAMITKSLNLKNSHIKTLSKADVEKIDNTIHNMQFKVRGVLGFKSAFVTSGGVNLKEIDKNTMESKIIKDMYFCGEITDINGECGGYNIQWAFSSAYVAGKSI